MGKLFKRKFLFYKMKNGFLFIVSFLLIIWGFGLLQAAQINGKEIPLTCQNVELTKGTFLGGEIPSFIPYQNEIFNMYLGNESFGHLSIEGGVLSDFSCEKSEDATYELIISNENIFENLNSNSSVVDTLNEKIKSKEIEINGLSFGKKAKWFFTKIALSVVGWFS